MFRIWNTPPTTSTAKTPDTREPANENPDFAVCVQTDGEWIYIAEFRTEREAMFIAQSTYIRTGMSTRVLDGHSEVWRSETPEPSKSIDGPRFERTRVREFCTR